MGVVMSLDTTQLAASSSGRVGILLGLTGLGAGVAAILTGYGVLGLVAGILALVAPATMLRESSRPRSASGARTGDPSKTDEVEEDDEVDALEHPGTQPFHMDSELLTAEYFSIAVKNRLTAARRFLKPLAIVQVQVESVEDPEAADADANEAVLKTLRDCDTAYVMGSGHLALVLEDTPESGAVWALERVRRSLADTNESVRMWAGVACYPAHAMDAEELMTQCSDALLRAREWPQDRIEVALAD